MLVSKVRSFYMFCNVGIPDGFTEADYSRVSIYPPLYVWAVPTTEDYNEAMTASKVNALANPGDNFMNTVLATEAEAARMMERWKNSHNKVGR